MRPIANREDADEQCGVCMECAEGDDVQAHFYEDHGDA
jgi:hypothetical protein